MAIIQVRREEVSVMRFAGTDDSFEQRILQRQMIIHLVQNTLRVNVFEILVGEWSPTLREEPRRRLVQFVKTCITILVSTIHSYKLSP